MKKYRILVLTDHSKHSKENSLYALVSTLSQHNQCKEVLVTSRGNTLNNPFFEEMNTEHVWALKAESKFGFQEDGYQFLKNVEHVMISSFDIIFLRLPRPVSDQFLHYLCEIAPKAIFVNHPKGIMETSTKAFLLNVPEVCPSMKLCRSLVEIRQFANQFPIVLKPLKEYGGKGIVKVIGNEVFDGNQSKDLQDYLLEHQAMIEQEGVLAMKFLKNVSEGDKRILVVNGQVLAASLRLPAENSWLCNVAQGGTSIVTEVTEKEQEIVNKIAPLLLKKGIVFLGVDTLVDDNGERILSEVNTLSIGGFPQSQAQTGKPVVQMAIDNMMNYINKKNQYANTESS